MQARCVGDERDVAGKLDDGVIATVNSGTLVTAYAKPVGFCGATCVR
jgi:hypothetical protein